MESTINQKNSPHEAWQEIRKTLKDEKINEIDLLQPWYEKGIEKFDTYRFPSIIARLQSHGLSQEDTAFIILGDHGEGKRTHHAHRSFGHAGELTEETIRIPFVVVADSFKKGTFNTDIHSTVDIKSICQSILDIEVKSPTKDTHVYCENWIPLTSFLDTEDNYVMGERALITKGKKYIVHGAPEILINTDFEKQSLEDLLRILYRNLYMRQLDQEGIVYFQSVYELNDTLTDVVDAFLESDEMKRTNFYTVYKIEKLKDTLVSSKKSFLTYFKKILEYEQQNTVPEAFVRFFYNHFINTSESDLI